MTLNLPQVKLALNAKMSAEEAACIVEQNKAVDLVELLKKNSRTMWPYLIYGYQCEYNEPSFVPQVFSPQLCPQAAAERYTEAASAGYPSSPTKFGVQVLQSKEIKSDFKGARKDDPLFKPFFDDLAKGKNKMFVAARLKAATGKEASFLDAPDAPPE